jgi:DNA-directed RNA polymerase specialized sigma24 family protein
MMGPMNLMGSLFNRAPRLSDQTAAFRTMIANAPHLPSAIVLHLGGRGSGKTGGLFILWVLLFAAFPEGQCAIVFFRCPETFMEKFRKYAPAKYHPHAFRVTEIRELDAVKKGHKYIVLCYDEGQRELNAKQALTKQARRLEKLIAISRQKDLWLLYNTQIQNVNKNLRMMTDIRLYKGNTKAMIEESDNPFAKEYGKSIVKLYGNKTHALFESSYVGLKTTTPEGKDKMITQGSVILDLFEIVPWWCDDLSRAYEGEDVSFDAEFDDYNEKDAVIQQCVELFLAAFPSAGKRDVTASIIRGFLYTNHRGIYYDAADKVQQICDIINFRLIEKRQAEKEAEAEEVTIPAADPGSPPPDPRPAWKPGQSFADYTRGAIPDPLTREVIYQFIEGESQKDIAGKLEKSADFVNSRIAKFREKEMGYLFEKWFAATHGGGTTAGTDRDPDFIDPQGTIYSLKCYCDRSKSLTFYQQTDFHPEFEVAKAKGVKYTVAVLNPFWDAKVRLVEVDPGGDEKVVVRKDDRGV